ncbi:MAG: hypothetical protein Q8P07_02825 [bacterium]|nr:hypothetical protein [bacterium]
MTRFILMCALAVWLVFPDKILAQNSYELSFVASDEELEAALKKGDALRGFAVRSAYYYASGEKTKEKIDVFVASIRNSLRPVFIYGRELRLEVFETWFQASRNFFQCKATSAGAFSTLPIGDALAEATNEGRLPGKTFLLCEEGHDGLLAEEDFRGWIDGYWKLEKQKFREEGYATLN